MLAALISFAFSALIAPHEEKSFVSWMRSTNQFFTGEEYNFRLGVFLANARLIQQHNQDTTQSFKLGLNKFTCLTSSEYKALLGRMQIASKRQHIVKNIKKNAAESVDWRDSGIVNAVKDQGSCGSCWAFGTIQACESSYAQVHGTLLSCSEQNLVDCVVGCSGCNGGMEYIALDHILQKQSGLLNSEDDYPYKAVDQKCTYDNTKGINLIKSYAHGKEGDEEYLKQLISQGVCDVAIDAGHFSFQAYTSGVYYEKSCSQVFLNHAVGCVGYGTDGKDYWLVRNSWGQSWGENGYIRMARNQDNNCGVASDALQVSA